MGRLNGKIAIITGAARGQGEAEARLFVEEGATVVLTDVLDDLGETVATEIGASYNHLDVRDESAWHAVTAAVTQQYGRVDILVNNAAIMHSAALLDTTIEDYQRVIDVNQVGVFLGMKTIATSMKEIGNSGSIVNISSLAGIEGTRHCTAYGASKWAVRGMTKVAALELGKFDIRVNSIHPGLIDTDMMRELPWFKAGKLDRVLKTIPLGRPASSDEVAQLALFLATDESSYCTGGEFIVDGGIHC